MISLTKHALRYSILTHCGEMPEWSNGPHSKCGVPGTVPRVRIPISPPHKHSAQTGCFVLTEEQRLLIKTFEIFEILRYAKSSNMKMLRFSLIVLLFISSGCVADVEKPPTPFPGSINDKIQDTPTINVVLPKNTQRREAIYSDGRVVDFLIIQFSNNAWSWGLANIPSDAKKVDDWRDNLNADLVINGAYFDEEMQPTGYYKESGQAKGSKPWPTIAQQNNRSGYTGMVKITNGELELIYLPEDNQNKPKIDEAVILTFPTLVAQGENQISEDSKKFAHRTVLAQDYEGNSYIILTESGSPSLYETAEWLKEQPENFRIAINLDGGNSTGISYVNNEATLDVSSVPVPNVIFLNKK